MYLSGSGHTVYRTRPLSCFVKTKSVDVFKRRESYGISSNCSRVEPMVFSVILQLGHNVAQNYRGKGYPITYKHDRTTKLRCENYFLVS